MTAKLTTPVVQATSGRVLQRKCACGTGASCEACGKKKELQRKATGPTTGEVPDVVYDVLRSPGQPLDAATRAFMEPRFGHDFSRVRVHTDARAAESARAVNADAYTVGQQIVFGPARHAPHDQTGRGLIAHELTHTLQQPGWSGGSLSIGAVNTPGERVAEAAAERVSAGGSVAVGMTIGGVTLQRQVMVEEPAGGCGVCYADAIGRFGPRNAGGVAHRLIQQDFEISHPLANSNFPNLVGGKVDFLPDLVLPVHNGLRVGEIKPANANGFAAGADKMTKYITAFRASFPDNDIGPLTEVMDPWVGVFPNPRAPACFQELFVNPPIDGVYGYYCQPPYSQVVWRPECQCDDGDKVRVPRSNEAEEKETKKSKEKQEKPSPVTNPTPAPAPEGGPQPAPSPETEPGKVIPFPGRPPKPNTEPESVPVAARTPLQRVGEFVHQMLQTGADVEAAAIEFLRANPELVSFLMGAAIGVIVATIAEDFPTLGWGIIDDFVIIPICARLIQVARAIQTGAIILTPLAASRQ